MHDLRALRDNPAEFDQGLARRGLPPAADDIVALDRLWRAAETRAQEAQARRNRLAREIGNAKKSGGDATALLQRSNADKEIEAVASAEATRLRREIDDRLALLPNLPADDVPVGPDESAN